MNSYNFPHKTVNLKRVCYISTAASNIDENSGLKIAEQAEAANKSQDITGLLLFNGVNFWQIIEGPTEAVDNLMEKIRRHTGIIMRFSETSIGRWFENWSLSYKKTSKTAAESLISLTIPSRVKAEAELFMNLSQRV
jgi:Sensors of blue-light using FAD